MQPWDNVITPDEKLTFEKKKKEKKSEVKPQILF